MGNKQKVLLTSMYDGSLSGPVIDRRGAGGVYNYIKFDYDNLFPQKLMDMVKASPIQSAISEALYTKLIGALINVPSNSIPNYYDSWNEIVRRCFRDYSIFEAFALQVVKNIDGKTYSFYHQPVSEVRLGKSEYGANDIKKAYLCSDWKQSKTAKIKEIKMFGSEQPKEGERYLFYFKDYAPGEIYYHVPSYFSAANWIVSDGKISKYYNNFISNSLSSSKVITYPQDMSEEEKADLYDSLREDFTGESAAGTFLLLFGDGTSSPKVESLSTPDADLYDSLNTTIRNNIITANRLSSPSLAGIATGSNMSSQAEELIAANTVYLNDVVIPKRTFVLSKINTLLLELNGIKDPITIEDLNLRKEFEGNNINNDAVEENASDAE